MRPKGGYSRQYKEQAMDLVRVRGQSVASASRELGIPYNTLALWLDKAGWVRPEEPGEAQVSDDPAALRVQVRDLQARVKHLEMEKDILKKATAFFAKEHR